MQLTSEEENYDVYIVDAAAGSGAKRIAIEDYRRLSYFVRRTHLTDSARLFMHDCAVGSARDSRYTLRIIANDAVPALFARFGSGAMCYFVQFLRHTESMRGLRSQSMQRNSPKAPTT